jgi:hypothetical protein
MGSSNFNALASALYSKQVTKIRVSGYGFGELDFEHITDLAAPGWQRTRAEVVADVINGYTYYVDNGRGHRAYLEAMSAKSILGQPYVRTRPDCTEANNLLSLPRF